MTQVRYNTVVPLGALVVSAPGSTVLLSNNCGSLGGQIGTAQSYTNPPVPGQPLRQIILVATGNDAALLPRGQTFSANAATVVAYLPKGVPVSIPYGTPFENGILPENFCLDSPSGASTVYGCGILS